MKKRYVIGGLILLGIAFFYINRNVYYIDEWKMYIIIENNEAKDTTTVYFSNSRWSFGDDYVKYCPQSAETSRLDVFNCIDTLYAVEGDMKIIETESKKYNIKAVHFIRGNKLKDERDYWSDSTFLKTEVSEWYSINHQHGIHGIKK